ncbi:MAG TPA: DUF6252 family protein [Bacteroidia bacterium]|jgi:hypothetical protein|nr:DUF6252 family protein [Bacteroidia bacterium]
MFKKSLVRISGISCGLFLMLAYSSCSKPTPATVAAAVGQGTFTATVNGTNVAFVPVATLNSGRYSITGTQSTAPLQEIVLYTSATGIGTYTLNTGLSTNGSTGTYATGPSSSQLTEYRTDSTNTGVLNITAFDATNKTMSGNFNFKAKQFSPTVGTTIVTITSGTFASVKWQ